MLRWLPALGVLAAGCLPLGDLDATAASQGGAGQAHRAEAGAAGASSGYGAGGEHANGAAGSPADTSTPFDGFDAASWPRDASFAPACDPECDCLPPDAKIYMLCRDATRDVAEQTCAQSGRVLVHIDDAGENRDVATLASQQSLDSPWIGLMLSREGVWSWDDGQELFWRRPATREDFSAWASGEPAGTHECVVMDEHEQWHTASCDETHDFVCELRQGA